LRCVIQPEARQHPPQDAGIDGVEISLRPPGKMIRIERSTEWTEPCADIDFSDCPRLPMAFLAARPVRLRQVSLAAIQKLNGFSSGWKAWNPASRACPNAWTGSLRAIKAGRSSIPDRPADRFGTAVRCATWLGTRPRAVATSATSTAKPICAMLPRRKATRRLMRKAARPSPCRC
jgi:hypothetical protein